MEKKPLLQEVEKDILSNLQCPLKDVATNLVFGKGNPDAKIVFIGEAPGATEDKLGKPFVGRAGQELDKLLQTIGLTINDVYITNILKYRPPKNRDPKPEEIARHTPYLIAQIKIINPRVIITLGNFSTKFVLSKFSVEGMNKIEGVSKLHGKPREVTVNENTWTVVPMYHPAAMLYRPQLREVIERDFKKVEKILGGVKTTKKLDEFF